jgi:cation:H+ antiporter
MSALAPVIIGLVGLVIGGELVVRGAVSAVSRFGFSPTVIGLTLAGIGTSTPEIVTSLQAALAGSPGIAIGNVMGSNISNVLFIMGTTAIFAPIAVNPAAFTRDGSVSVCVMVLNGWLARAA